MATIERSIDVEQPLRTVYNQWTQFEMFPSFMEGIVYVDQLDDKRLEWCASVAGAERTWTAEITDQQPDTRIAWASTSGARNDGSVSFTGLSPQSTRVDLQLEIQPEGLQENLGSALGLVEGRVRGDLERFKSFIEARYDATGAWRGEIQDGVATTGDEAMDPMSTARSSRRTQRQANGETDLESGDWFQTATG